MKKIVFIAAVTFSLNSHAQFLEGWIGNLRPYFEKVIGENLTDKIMGTEDKIQLPSIPKLSNDARSIEIYEEDQKVLKDTVSNRKAHKRFIEEVVLVTKLRKANENDMARWMNVLTQGGSREGVYRALVLDDSYAGLENFEQPSNDSVVEFTRKFFKKFVGLELKQEKALSMNFYNLKRETTEKALEILDLLKSNDHDMAAWFAVFSSDLATWYPNIFESKSRLIIKKQPHYNWAIETHEQLIKSEVIVKIHKVMNHLMGYENSIR